MLPASFLFNPKEDINTPPRGWRDPQTSEVKWSEISLKSIYHQHIFKMRQLMGQSQISFQLSEVSHKLKHRKPGNRSTESTALTHVQITSDHSWARLSDPLSVSPNPLDHDVEAHSFLPHVLDSGAFVLPPQQDYKLNKDKTVPSHGNHGNSCWSSAYCMSGKGLRKHLPHALQTKFSCCLWPQKNQSSQTLCNMFKVS